MASEQLIKALLTDPLAGTTRAKRRTLLALALVAIAVVKAKLVPTSVSTFGINLTADDQDTLLRILSWVIFYFLSAFLLYAIRDALVLRANYLGLVDKDLVQRGTKADEIEQRAMMHSMGFWKRYRLLAWVSWTAAAFRWLLDLVLPVVLGIYTLSILWE